MSENQEFVVFDGDQETDWYDPVAKDDITETDEGWTVDNGWGEWFIEKIEGRTVVIRESTPSMAEIRFALVQIEPTNGPAYDRAIAAHDAEVRLEVIRGVAELVEGPG